MLISWNVTKACNLKCSHCYRDAGKKEPDELDFEEAEFLLKDIAQAGFKIIILSGGEPLLRKDIFDLVTFASACGLRPVLGTNGTLITEATAKKLKNAGLTRAGISLDSVDAKIHDAFRKKTGAWEKTVCAMRFCKDQGLDFQVHTTVTKMNFREIEKITDFAQNLGARAHHIFFLVPTGRGKDINDVVLSNREYWELLEKILKKQKEAKLELKPVCAPQFIPFAKEMNMDLRFQRGCLAGISYCCILPNADVHPCPYLPINLGNVRQTPFSRIWQENLILIKLRGQDYSGHCSVCEFKQSCGGCRARAYYHSNDYMAEDPDCRFACNPQAKIDIQI